MTKINTDLIQEDLDNLHSTISTEISDINTYSTTEINTGKTWIDGKPIYRKVVSGNRNGSYTDVNYSSWGVDNFVKIDFVVDASNGNYKYLLPYYNDNTDLCRMFVAVVGSKITLHCGSSFPGTTGAYKVIVEYTKTTD